MTHLDRYILREALPVFLFGLVLYVSFGLISNLLPRAQWMGTAELGSILKWLALQVPYAAVQAMPIAGLLAVMLAFGRLARENELLVMQAGGISVLRTARPFLLGGLLLSGFSLALSEWVVPWTNRATALVYWNELIPERTPQFNLVGRELTVGEYILRYDGFDPAKDEFQRVRLERWQEQTMTVILAQTARLQGQRIVLRDYRVFTLDFAQLPLPEFATLEAAQEACRASSGRKISASQEPNSPCGSPAAAKTWRPSTPGAGLKCPQPSRSGGASCEIRAPHPASCARPGSVARHHRPGPGQPDGAVASPAGSGAPGHQSRYGAGPGPGAHHCLLRGF